MIHGLGERLHNLRRARNLSQKEVSNALGISASVLSNYESGERTPSIENLVTLSSFYRCSTDYLLGIDRSTTLNVSSLSETQIQVLQAFLSTIK